MKLVIFCKLFILNKQVIINKLLFIVLNLSSLMIFFVYKSKALLISILLLWINSKNVFLVERLSPSIRNPIFDLILDCDFIWTTSQSLSQWLFMKFVKLVVKLSDHLLNTLCLFLLVKFTVNCIFDVFICILTFSLLSRVWFLQQNLTDFSSRIFL